MAFLLVTIYADIGELVQRVYTFASESLVWLGAVQSYQEPVGTVKSFHNRCAIIYLRCRQLQHET